jgi:hypothetical protein
MDRAPDEIFGLIFENCFTGPFPELDPIRRPQDIAILNVSQKWRRIALSTPTLWCSICLTTNPYPPANVISEYLALSGSCPLDMVVAHEPHECWRSARLLGKADISSLNFILDYTHRCRRASWHVRWGDYFPIEERFCLARTLVELYICCSAPPDPAPKDMTLTFPSLKTLRISGSADPRFPLFVAPKLRRIVFSYVTTSDAERIHSFLALVAGTLEILQFDSCWIGSGSRVDEFPGLTPLELPAIKCISMQMREGSSMIHAYFDYPRHVVGQIRHSFRLEYECPLYAYMKRIRSEFIDYLVLINPTNPYVARGGDDLTPSQDTPSKKWFIHDLFRNLPGLTTLCLRNFDQSPASYICHSFKETRSSTMDRLRFIVDEEEFDLDSV